jgi:hypothetical protein
MMAKNPLETNERGLIKDQRYFTFFNALKQYLCQSGWEYALEMVAAIQKMAAIDPAYAKHVALWIKTGSTVILRDELCEPFSDFSFVRRADPSIPLAYVNMWEAIDSSWRHANAAMKEASINDQAD